MAWLFPFSILFSPSSPWLQYDTAQFSAEEPCMLEQRIEEVNKANHAFYAAFGNLDIGEMDKIWAHLEYVTCIHPGWTLRSGWPLVRDSFELTDVMVQVAGDIAWVVCVENITTHQSDEPQQAQVIAMNLFERIGDEWLMIHHHGSAVMG
jgi:hypothetical protein